MFLRTSVKWRIFDESDERERGRKSNRKDTIGNILRGHYHFLNILFIIANFTISSCKVRVKMLRSKGAGRQNGGKSVEAD